MTIASISWVRNEEDIIESFVRHHIAIVSHMTIIDNASTDKTSHILAQLTAEGLPLQVMRDESITHRQGEALTELMHKQSDPETWLIPLDADEFLRADGSLQIILPTLPRDCITLLPWHTYIPCSNDNQHEQCVLRRIVHRKEREDPPFYKILIPPEMQGKQYTIPVGSHGLHAANGQACDSSVSEELFLAHFPVRSALQIYHKVRDGWQRHSVHPAKKHHESYHWKQWSVILPKPENITIEHLQRIALDYALPKNANPSGALMYDPFPCDIDLKYAL